MKDVRGTRKGRRFFMCSAGMWIASSVTHDFSSEAFSAGRSIEQSEKRKSTRMRSGASFITAITVGNSRQSTDGIGLTCGGAKTFDTRASGLCSM